MAIARQRALPPLKTHGAPSESLRAGRGAAQMRRLTAPGQRSVTPIPYMFNEHYSMIIYAIVERASQATHILATPDTPTLWFQHPEND